jgi:hypothetical protein
VAELGDIATSGLQPVRKKPVPFVRCAVQKEANIVAHGRMSSDKSHCIPSTDDLRAHSKCMPLVASTND